MGECLDKVVLAIYGDQDTPGCPRCPLFGMAVAVTGVIVGYGLTMASAEGSINPEYHLVGLVTFAIGIFLAIVFLVLAFLSESRYQRIVPRSTDQPRSTTITSTSSDATDTSTLTSGNEGPSNPVNIAETAPAPMFVFEQDNHPNDSESSDSFMVLDQQEAPNAHEILMEAAPQVPLAPDCFNCKEDTPSR